MPKKGEKKGKDGRYYMPEQAEAIQEPKVEEKKFEAPYIRKNVSEPKRKYYFENRRQPGQPLNFFAGNAPVKGNPPSENDVKTYKMEHGTEVELTESMARHIRSKGVQKPIHDKDFKGDVVNTGRVVTDRKFDLYEV